MTDPRLLDFLEHIVTAAQRVERYLVAVDLAKFMADEMVQDAVIRNLQNAGEASNSIVQRFPEFIEAHPQLELRQARAMRNVLVHDYSGVDLAVVWETAKGALPRLAAEIQTVLDELEDGSDEPDQ